MGQIATQESAGPLHAKPDLVEMHLHRRARRLLFVTLVTVLGFGWQGCTTPGRSEVRPSTQIANRGFEAETTPTFSADAPSTSAGRGAGVFETNRVAHDVEGAPRPEGQFTPRSPDPGPSSADGNANQVAEPKIVKKFRLDAESGATGSFAHDVALDMLGSIYERGIDAPKDMIEAIKWYRLGAEQGGSYAQRSLGRIYASGDGVPQDTAEGLKWLHLAAGKADSEACYYLGTLYTTGEGVPIDPAEGAKWLQLAKETVNGRHPFEAWATRLQFEISPGSPWERRWYRFAAEAGNPAAQCAVGLVFATGDGVPKDFAEADKWYRRAAKLGDSRAQFNLGLMYRNGEGVPKNFAEAVKWYRLAAEQGVSAAQCNLGGMYGNGEGVPRDDVIAYMWENLAAAGGSEVARSNLAITQRRMTAGQIAEAQRLSREWRPRSDTGEKTSASDPGLDAKSMPAASGTGFFITSTGFFVTSAHVVTDARRITIESGGVVLVARVIQLDAANDFALLKCEGQFSVLPVSSSGKVRMGDRVVTLGFPNPEMQGRAPKFSQGEIASLTGPQDDPRFFQVSLPIQPGNSGGPLVDARGAVIGVVAARLDQLLALKVTGQLSENVNYAVKGSHLLAFLESVPNLADQLREPRTSPIPEGELPALVEAACAMVTVYR